MYGEHRYECLKNTHILNFIVASGFAVNKKGTNNQLAMALIA